MGVLEYGAKEVNGPYMATKSVSGQLKALNCHGSNVCVLPQRD